MISENSPTQKTSSILFVCIITCITYYKNSDFFVSDIKTMKNQFLAHKKLYFFGILFGIFSIIGIVYLVSELKDGSNTDESMLKSSKIEDENLVKNIPITTTIGCENIKWIIF